MGLFSMLAVPIFCVVFSIHHAAGTGADLTVTPAVSHDFIKKGDFRLYTCKSKLSNISLTWDVPQGFTERNGFAKDSFMEKPPSSIAGMVAELTITNHEVPGRYKCVAKNSSSLLESYPIDLYTITEENTRVEREVFFTREEDTVELSCKISAQGVEIGEPTWKKNGTPIADVKTDGSKLEQDMEILVISDVMRSDAGPYSAEYPLKVGSIEDTYKCQVDFKAGPLVLDFPKSKNLIEGENFELPCKVLGYPAPAIKWMKDGNDLESSDRVSMHDYQGVVNATLKVKNVVFEDAGKYTCSASSEEMNSTSNKDITVRVKDKYAALWPFLGIVGEVFVLCTIIFIYEKRRSRQAEQDDAAQDEAETVPRGNVRNRRNQK